MLLSFRLVSVISTVYKYFVRLWIVLSKYSADDFAEHYNNSRGMACVFSLKNPTYPEYTCLSSCAMSCVDVNPFHAHMLAVGLVDGWGREGWASRDIVFRGKLEECKVEGVVVD